MSDDKCDTDGLNRRSVLKSTAALGAVPFTAQAVGATPEEASVDVEETLRQPSVRELVSEIPEVAFDTTSAIVYGAESSVVVVPANYGKLVVDAPSVVADEASASFYFDRHVPGVQANWPAETAARLTTTGDSIYFERTTTNREKRSVLDKLGYSKFGIDGTSVSVSPDQDRVSIMHVDRDDRVVKTVEATGSVTTDGRVSTLDSISETTYTESEVKSELSGQAKCDDSLLLDIVYCIIDYSDCALCAFGTAAPPVIAACILIVCFDGGLSLAVEYYADFGCSAVAEGGYDCLKEIVDLYADQIPDLPEENPPKVL